MKAEFTILVVDSSDDRRDGLCRAILAARPGAKIYTHNAGDGGWLPEEPAAVKSTLTLFHWSNEAKLKDDSINEPVTRSSIRLFYSGGGVPPSQKLAEGWSSIPRPIDHANHLSRREWEELLAWAENPSHSFDHLPRALHADFPRVATALLILCQGFEAMNTGEVPDPCRVKAALCDQVWWRAPFAPIKDLDAELRRELGTTDLPKPVKKLVSWINQAKDQPSSVGRIEDPKDARKLANADNEQGLIEMVMAAESVLSRELGAPMMAT